MWSWFQCLRWGRHSATEQPDGEETIERRDEWFSKFFCWSRLQLETHLAPHWCLWERPRELMKDRGTLLYWSHWFHPLPLKKSHPSPSPFSPPPQTGKPLLNNIIAYFILTVTSARGKKAWLNHSGVLFSPLTADCALCVWVGDFDCSFFFFTRRCLHFFFFVWGELLLSCFSSSYSKQKTGEAEWERCTFETALIVSLFTGRLIWNIWIREILR